MAKWVVSVPCWGQEYVNRFLSGPVQSMAHSIRHSGVNGRLIINADEPFAFDFPWPITFIDRPKSSERYSGMTECHIAALRLADDGDIYSPMCSDLTVSKNFFGALQQRLSQGFDVVAGLGPSTVAPGPQTPMSGAELMSWAVERFHDRHAINIWPPSATAASLFFFRTKTGMSVWCGHQHPIAVRVGDKARAWKSGSCDEGLLDGMPSERIYTIQDCSEASYLDSTPKSERAPRARMKQTEDEVAQMIRGRKLKPIHKELYKRRITLTGSTEPDEDCEIMARVFAKAGI